MSRNKKTRKPSVRSTGFVKEESKTIEPRTDKKPKKQTGNKPGNRQQEANPKSHVQNKASAKDPRIGNKTPIVLIKETPKPSQKTAKAKIAAVAPILTIEPEEATISHEALEKELYAIEDNEQLQAILAKQEDEISLTEAEITFFNESMERHQQIRETLGLDDEEDEEDSTEQKVSGDDLWDKFDKSDLSDFE